MRKLFVVLLFGIAITSFAEAQMVVEVSSDLLDGKWVNERIIAFAVEVGANGDPVVYADVDVPDHNCISNTDEQTWYIESGAGGWNKITFLASDVGILQGRKTVQYALRYAPGGIFSDWNSKVILKPKPGNSP